MKYPTPLVALIVIFASFVFAAPLPSETVTLRNPNRFKSIEQRTPASTVCRAFCRTLAKELKVHAASFAIDAGKQYLDYARAKNSAPTDANTVRPMSGKLQGTGQSSSKANSDAIDAANSRKRLALDISQQIMTDSREKQASLAKKVKAFNRLKAERGKLSPEQSPAQELSQTQKPTNLKVKEPSNTSAKKSGQKSRKKKSATSVQTN